MSGSSGDSPCLLTLSASILQAYVHSNPVPPSALPALLADIGRTLRAMREELSGPWLVPTDQSAQILPRQLSISIAKTIGRDYIISLENGQKYRSLKRHLKSLGMTAEEYRTKWGLSDDYPLVAPSLSALRADQVRSRAKRKPPAEPSLSQADGQPSPLPV